MWKYFFANKTKKWLDVLPDFVENYNHIKHWVVKMKPVEVNKDNKHRKPGILKTPEFKVGDLVHVTNYKSIFTKGYKPNFLEEVYEVTQVLQGKK